MIHFNLKCSCGNKFDVWFRNSDDFENQKNQKFLTCPACGSSDIDKAPMAPNLAKTKKDNIDIVKAVSVLRENIKKNCEYVGSDFPEEARKIHYGEEKPRGIYGEAKPEEAKKLKEEGIDVIILPFSLKTDA